MAGARSTPPPLLALPQVVCGDAQPSTDLHNELLALERHLLATLGHRLSLPTCKTFLRRSLYRTQSSGQVYYLAG